MDTEANVFLGSDAKIVCLFADFLQEGHVLGIVASTAQLLLQEVASVFLLTEAIPPCVQF